MLCCFGDQSVFMLLNNHNCLRAILTSLFLVPLWLVSSHSLVCYMHCRQSWGETYTWIVIRLNSIWEENIDQVWSRIWCTGTWMLRTPLSENQYFVPQQTTKICVCDFPASHGLYKLCKYCSIIALSFVCYTCVVCAIFSYILNIIKSKC